MSKVVGEVAINVGADISGLVREMRRGEGVLSGFDRAAQLVAGGLDRFGKRATDLGKKMTIVSAAIGGVVAASYGLAASTAEAGDAIAKSARQAGVSADYYQEMAYAIGQVTNLTRDELDAAFVRLNKTIGEAADGSKSATEALEKLGFSQSQIASGTITTQQAFDAYITKLDGVDGSAEAAAISADLFGKAGAKMGGQLAGASAEISRLRSDAQSLGLVMSGETLNSSEKFGDQVDTLTQRWGALKNVIGAEVLPLFTEYLIPKINDVIIPAMAKVAQSVGEWIRWFNDLPEPVKDAVGLVAAAIGAGGPLLLAIGAASAAISAMIAATGPVGLFIAAAVALGAAWAKWGDDFKTAVGGAIEWVTGKFNDFLAMLDRVIQKAKDVGTAIAESLSYQPGDGQIQNGTAPGRGPTPGGADWLGGGGGAGGAMGGQMMGAAIVNGMVLGATQSLEENRAALMEVFNQVPAIARETLGIQSPSKVFAEIGNFLGLGMAQGINDSTALVGTAVKGMTDTAKAAADAGVSDVLGSLGQLFQGSKKISAGIALANSWLAFTEVLKDPAYTGRPWARFAAAASALSAGLNAVRSIKSAQPGGTGSGGGASSAGASGGGGQAAPAQTMNFTIQNDPFGYGERFARSIAEQMNAARRSGSSIIATVSSS